ncbi:winged helix-turn-helix transcriptional regulator [Anaerovorax sp. IOR16]|uniref:winged helix-turn-helix transcriptional regulator n=1 Tax=Anaerovorax sp. IOR16 TaxID=2773458 RepID=UPI0019D256AA|nr:helix-turn-helix domain-containing protein [Anaerovorax sp. IOR16]
MTEKKECCPCSDICPLEDAMRIIGGKWKVQILCSLYRDGSTRFNELKRKMKGISNTMLANALKELEQDGLVKREQFMEIPPHVEYTATPKCDGLIPILIQLAQWSMNIKS